MAEDFMKLIDDEFDRGINPRRIEIDVNKLNLTPEEHDKAFRYIEFKRKHFSHNKQVKKNGVGVALSVFFILLVSGIFSTGVFLSFTQESEVEMFSPPVEENVDLREFNAEPLTKSGISLNMDVGMTREFFYQNKKYSLKLLASGKNYADLEISLNNTKFSVYQGKETRLDLTLDGKDDISMMLLFTEYQKANLRVKILEDLPKIDNTNKISCERDDDCDDNKLETYDVCDSETKFCVNAESVVCKFNEDCPESANYTVRCIKKSGKLPYCEYALPDQCNDDDDCDDGNFTTEDTCVILPTSTNYCQYELADQIDCGRTVDILLANKTAKDNDEVIKCFNQYLNTDFDLDVRFLWNETRIDLEIRRLKDSKSNLYVEFDRTPNLFKEYENEYIECEYKDLEILDLSRKNNKSAVDANLFIKNVLNSIEDFTFSKDKDCVGTLNNEPSILNIPDVNITAGQTKYINLTSYVSDVEDDLKDLKIVATNYDINKVDIDFVDYNQKLKIIAKNQSVEEAKLVVTDTIGASTVKIVKITIN
ncbi:hypothetical protein KY334_00720 [Candidatus Woesearchaeota archaeon]|nr:hypothetical protein [Candidatus Woesearchaeota archaeon]